MSCCCDLTFAGSLLADSEVEGDHFGLTLL